MVLQLPPSLELLLRQTRDCTLEEAVQGSPHAAQIRVTADKIMLDGSVVIAIHLYDVDASGIDVLVFKKKTEMFRPIN